MLVTVGTARGGFDALVEAADRAAAELGLEGLAQIGDGRLRPRRLAWRRFLPRAELWRLLARRPLVVTHGGMGLLGEAMRAGCRIVAVPRREPTTAAHPSNDQRAFLASLARLQPITVCRDPALLRDTLERVAAQAGDPVTYRLGSNVSRIVVEYLARGIPPGAAFTDRGTLP